MSTQSFNAPSLSGMQATLSRLQIPPASFASSNQPWIVAPKDASAPGSVVEEQLKDLLLAAHSISESMMIGSVLAGPSSETDEFADVALWIPGNTLNDPKDVLQTLGLSSWTNDITPIELQDGALPSLCSDSSSEQTAQLRALMSSFAQPRAFSVSSGDAYQAFFYVGRVAHGPSQGLAGMIGIGVFS